MVGSSPKLVLSTMLPVMLPHLPFLLHCSSVKRMGLETAFVVRCLKRLLVLLVPTDLGQSLINSCIPLGLMAPEVCAALHPIDDSDRPLKGEAGLGTYAASDGQLVTFGVFTPLQNQVFWSELRKEGFQSEEDASEFSTTNWTELWKQNERMLSLLPKIVASMRSARAWEKWLHERGLPGSAVATLAEACQDARLKHFFFKGAEGVTLPTLPFRMESGGPTVTSPPPKLGSHTSEILQLVATEKEIESLAQK